MNKMCVELRAMYERNKTSLQRTVWTRTRLALLQLISYLSCFKCRRHQMTPKRYFPNIVPDIWKHIGKHNNNLLQNEQNRTQLTKLQEMKKSEKRLMRKVGNVASLHWLGIAFIALCWSDKKGSKVRSLGKSSYSVALLYTCCSNLRKYECSCNPAFSKIQPHVHLSKAMQNNCGSYFKVEVGRFCSNT